VRVGQNRLGGGTEQEQEEEGEEEFGANVVNEEEEMEWARASARGCSGGRTGGLRRHLRPYQAA